MSAPQDVRFRRPESVLVVVYTTTGMVLLLQRSDLPEFWQSVTGTLEAEEAPLTAARRELLEETGITGMELTDRQTTNQFRISPHWAKRYAPGTTHNTEHVFTLQIAEQMPIKLNPTEHLAIEWLDIAAAMARCSSSTNRTAIEQFVLPAFNRP